MKKKFSICVNIVIIILEIIGLYITVKALGLNSFIYYTQLSNIFLLIACILYLFKDKIRSRVVDIIKFGSTLSVLITFLVVLFFLGPMTEYGYHWFFLEESNLYYHLLCPVLSIITFIFFDDIKINGFKDILFAFIFTFIYSVIFMILNILKVIEGPYPFLLVYENPIYISVLWFIIIDGGTLLIAWILERIKCK